MTSTENHTKWHYRLQTEIFTDFQDFRSFLTPDPLSQKSLSPIKIEWDNFVEDSKNDVLKTANRILAYLKKHGQIPVEFKSILPNDA